MSSKHYSTQPIYHPINWVLLLGTKEASINSPTSGTVGTARYVTPCAVHCCWCTCKKIHWRIFWNGVTRKICENMSNVPHPFFDMYVPKWGNNSGLFCLIVATRLMLVRIFNKLIDIQPFRGFIPPTRDNYKSTSVARHDRLFISVFCLISGTLKTYPKLCDTMIQRKSVVRIPSRNVMMFIL